MLSNISLDLARTLTAFTAHPEAVQALREYALAQIQRINEQWHITEPNDVAGMAILRGQYQVFKQLSTLKEDVKSALQGRT